MHNFTVSKSLSIVCGYTQPYSVYMLSFQMAVLQAPLPSTQLPRCYPGQRFPLAQWKRLCVHVESLCPSRPPDYVLATFYLVGSGSSLRTQSASLMSWPATSAACQRYVTVLLDGFSTDAGNVWGVAWTLQWKCLKVKQA